MAASVFDFFQDTENQRLLDDLKSVGVDPKAFRAATTADGDLPFAGKTFVLTGTLPTHTRPEAEALIKKCGGKVTGSVSKSTSYLLTGAEPGSKIEKARQLNIPIIDEAQLVTMANRG